MTIHEYEQTWSDFHKDAYGFRPRGPMPQLTEEQWKAEFDMLASICEANRESEAKSQAEAIQATEALLAKLQREQGAQDRATALRWLHDAHETGGDNEYLCYSLGLPYGYFFQPA